VTADPLNLAALRQVAEAATPGPWVHEGADYDRPSRNVRAQHQQGWPLQGVAYNVGRTADAAHIATFDPPTVLALLDLAERATAVRDGEHVGGCNDRCEGGAHYLRGNVIHPAILGLISVGAQAGTINGRAYIWQDALSAAVRLAEERDDEGGA
jgi:hypothetical protein